MFSVYAKNYTKNDFIILIYALSDIKAMAKQHNLQPPSASLSADLDRLTNYLVRKASEGC